MSNSIWVSKDASGNINGVFANPQSFQVTQTTSDDPAVVAYLNPPPPIPDITHRQFYQQLAVAGIITQPQALAMVQTGSIPPALQTIINGMPSGQQFSATMMLCATEDISRNHPVTIQIGTAYGMTPAQMDAFFQQAALL